MVEVMQNSDVSYRCIIESLRSMSKSPFKHVLLGCKMIVDMRHYLCNTRTTDFQCPRFPGVWLQNWRQGEASGESQPARGSRGCCVVLPQAGARSAHHRRHLQAIRKVQYVVLPSPPPMLRCSLFKESIVIFDPFLSAATAPWTQTTPTK